MKCPKCNFENPQTGKFCQNCGYPLPEIAQGTAEPPKKKAWYKRWWIWLLIVLCTLMLMINSLCVCGIILPNSRKSTSDSASKQHTEDKTTTEELDAETLINKITDNGFEEVPASVLYNHYEDYKDKKVVTAIKVTSTTYHTLYSEIDKDARLSKLSFDFDKSSDINGAKEGDYVIVFGVGDGVSFIDDYREYKKCFVAAVGEQAEIEYDKLTRQAIDTEKQKQYQAEEKAKKEKDDFINSCEAIDYETLSRNPDKYKGEKFTFKGKVMQVVEPDTLSDDKTILRINVTKNEDLDILDDTIICTVTIATGTDRILEDDIITIWGTCNGLTSYTSIFGQKISLPEMDIKYYEIEE